ncbi:hypothetical protein BJ322DRAFT_1105065 [Thelephora terrestris]|uniref:Uncharacterized protein n=1 Tax=Thelephora terrestris TaxID=56493 RepID=A0A9P6HKK9_9AGAM|nr:hypothetical protein BJ322DRAFT_1105065 [Thelephora terrestris]
MRTVGTILAAAGTALSLLCIIAPQVTVAANLQAAEKKISAQPSQSIPDVIGILPKLEGLADGAFQLPPWEKIFDFADGFVKAADKQLNAAAREFNVAEKIDEFRNTFHNIVAASSEIRGDMTELTQQGLTLGQISDELGVIFNDVLEYLKKTFPPPDQAPGHEQRQEMVETVLDRAEQGLLDFARKHGMSQDGLEKLRSSFDRLKPHIEKLVVITADLIEQHPVIFSALVFSGVAMLVPESWFLRPLLSMIGYGPYGPIKGTAASWAQRRFWGAVVSRGSWFAFLQRAGMKGIALSRPFMGVIGAVIGGVVGALFPCFSPRDLFENFARL